MSTRPFWAAWGHHRLDGIRIGKVGPQPLGQFRVGSDEVLAIDVLAAVDAEHVFGQQWLKRVVVGLCLAHLACYRSTSTLVGKWTKFRTLFANLTIHCTLPFSGGKGSKSRAELLNAAVI